MKVQSLLNIIIQQEYAVYVSQKFEKDNGVIIKKNVPWKENIVQNWDWKEYAKKQYDIILRVKYQN